MQILYSYIYFIIWLFNIITFDITLLLTHSY
nr:MAG TPA: hypothetical protein [Caudoviricetes sp.]